MKLKNKIFISLGIVLSVLVFTQTNAQARKKLFSGRADGMASLEVTAKSLGDVASAVKYIFNEDGYNLKSGYQSQLRFSRSSGRMKDIAYGGLASKGTYEQVIIDIHDNGSGQYRIECNVYMTGEDENPGHMDTKVLKLFGREYKRMLRRVKRKIN